MGSTSDVQASGPLQGVIPLAVAENLLTVETGETRLLDSANLNIWSAPGVNLQIDCGIRPWIMPSLAEPLQTFVQLLPRYSSVWGSDPIVITSGYRVCVPETRSMHCEARALDIQATSDSLQSREEKTRRMAGLAWLAGFDWVEHEDPEEHDKVENPLMHVSKTRSFATDNFGVQLNSPADLLVTAPDGSRSGVDPLTGEIVEEIALGAFTGRDEHPQAFSMIQPEDGMFTVQVTGSGIGNYTIVFSMTDLQGESKEISFDRAVGPGLVSTFHVEYSSNSVSEISVTQIVDIDVKPGSDRNPINLNANGVIPITIFTTADFNASWVDVSTVQFAGASVAHWAFEDVDGDGQLDLVLHFRLQDTHLLDTYAELLRQDLEDGKLDETRKTVDALLTGRASKDDEDFFDFLGSDSVDLFLAGRKLKDLLKAL